MSCDTMNDNDNWSIPCFDVDDWEPNPVELDKMFVAMEKGQFAFQLEWKCPERRTPTTPTAKQEHKTPELKKEPEKNKDYDFMDELSSNIPARVRSTNSTPKGSAKKKTTNFAGVLDSMKKHGRLGQN